MSILTINTFKSAKVLLVKDFSPVEDIAKVTLLETLCRHVFMPLRKISFLATCKRKKKSPYGIRKKNLS